MSQELLNGWSVSTGCYSPKGDCVEIRADGRLEEIRMSDAIDAISKAFGSEELADDSVFTRYKRYLKSFYPRKGMRRDPDMVCLWPALEGSIVEETGFDEDDPGPTVEILGHELTRNDLILFTDYVVTNLSIETESDPRLTFLDSLR